MNGMLAFSYVLLWILVLVQAVVLVAVLRQLGVLLLRMGPRPALNLASMGPDIGQPAPGLTKDIEGQDIPLMVPDGSPGMAGTLLVFSSPTCGSCSMIPPSLSSLAASYNELGFCVIASGKRDLLLDYRRRFPKRVTSSPTTGASARLIASATFLTPYSSTRRAL